MPISSVHVFTAATSSASPELNVMDFCVELHDLIIWEPHMMIPPLVGFAVRLQPAQSESENPVNLSCSPCVSYLSTALCRPTRYLPNLFNFLQPPLVGADIPLQISFTAYWMSGRSAAK